MEKPRFSVSELLAVINQTLDYAYPLIEVEGEVSSFKVNQGKYVFFDLKDDESSVGCFMMLFSLRMPIEDGMKVIISAQPKLTKWGKFSLTVKLIRPVGEGSLKKSFELLKAKLDKEGLFSEERKRSLPAMPRKIAVISSTEAAGYADFIKILNNRWGGLKVQTAHVQVQGDVAADQIIRAIEFFNTQSEQADVLVLVRGGGSADDLSAFNDEKLVRALAASRIPTLVGVGHEIDVTLSDLVADRRAATPSNAAEIVVPDKREIARLVEGQVYNAQQRFLRAINNRQALIYEQISQVLKSIEQKHKQHSDKLSSLQAILRQLNPEAALKRGYSILRGKLQVGEVIEVETFKNYIKAEVKDVKRK